MNIGICVEDIVIAGGIKLLLDTNPLADKYPGISQISSHLLTSEKADYDFVICCEKSADHQCVSIDRKKLVLLLGDESVEQIPQRVKENFGAILLKKELQSNLIVAVYNLWEENRYFSPGITVSLIANTNAISAVLSEREYQIARLINKGCKSSEIAEKLFLSITTVATHRKNIFKKLDVHSAEQLRGLFEKEGM